MAWKKGRKPEQYLFSITEDFSENWKTFKDEAKHNNQKISVKIYITISTIMSDLRNTK